VQWQAVEVLARNPGRLITQAQLLERVWGITDTKNNYVRVYLLSIRRKLEPDPAHPRYFLTEHRSGVRFDPQGRGEGEAGAAGLTTVCMPPPLWPQKADRERGAVRAHPTARLAGSIPRWSRPATTVTSSAACQVRC